MPTVTRYGPRRVAPERLPGVRKTAAETDLSTGAGFQRERANTFRAAAQFGERAFEITSSAAIAMAEKAKREADETAFLEASNRFTERMNAWQYDPEQGAFTKKGKDAQPLPDEFNEVFTRNASELGESLKTDEQRQAFAKFLAQQRSSIGVAVNRHVYGEMQTYFNNEAKSALENARATAIANANDPRRVGEVLSFAEGVARSAAQRNGLGPEATEAAVDELRSTVHEGVIGRLLAQGNTGGARAYFGELKGQLRGEALERVEKAIQEGTIREQTQSALGDILAQGGTLEEQRKRAREKYSGELEDRVLAGLEHEDQLKQARDRDAIDQIMVNGKNIIDRTGRVESIPPADWARLSPAQASSLQNYADAKAQGRPIKTVFAEQYRLKMLAADKPEDFVKVNLNEYIDRISPSDLDELANLQLQMKKGDGKAAEKQYGGFRTANQVVDDTLGRYGFNPNAKPDTAEGQAILLAREMLDRRVTETQALLKKELQPDEVRQIFETILSQNVEVKGALWGSSTKPLVRLTIDDVGTHRPAIEQALRFAGRPVDDTSIVAFDAEVRSRLGGDISGNAITKIPRRDVQDIAAALVQQGKSATPDAIVQLYIQLLATGAVR